MSDQICLVKNRYRCNYLITITLFNYFYFYASCFLGFVVVRGGGTYGL